MLDLFPLAGIITSLSSTQYFLHCSSVTVLGSCRLLRTARGGKNKIKKRGMTLSFEFQAAQNPRIVVFVVALNTCQRIKFFLTSPPEHYQLIDKTLQMQDEIFWRIPAFYPSALSTFSYATRWRDLSSHNCGNIACLRSPLKKPGFFLLLSLF